MYLYDTHAGKCTAAKNYLDNISVKLLKHVHSSFSDMNCIVLQITMQLYCIINHALKIIIIPICIQYKIISKAF